jgi:hypothetical protein
MRVTTVSNLSHNRNVVLFQLPPRSRPWRNHPFFRSWSPAASTLGSPASSNLVLTFSVHDSPPDRGTMCGRQYERMGISDNDKNHVSNIKPKFPKISNSTDGPNFFVILMLVRKCVTKLQLQRACTLFVDNGLCLCSTTCTHLDFQCPQSSLCSLSCVHHRQNCHEER